MTLTSLVHCKCCMQQHSQHALWCTSCGHPSNRLEVMARFGYWVAKLGAALFFFAVFSWCLSMFAGICQVFFGY